MKLLLVCASLIACITAAAVKLPAGVETCEIESDQRDECIRSNFERVLPKLAQGFPELGIPVLDPLERDTMVFEYARGPLHVHVQATDIRIAGVSQTQVKAVRTTIAGDRMDAEIETHFPQLQVSGAYKSDNDYQGLRFGSAGKFNITMKQLSTTEKMSGQFVQRDGDKFYVLEHFDLDVEMEEFAFDADGVFPDAELTKTVIGFVNSYWKSLYQTILPQTKPVWEAIVVQETNKILAHLPISAVLVDSKRASKA